MSKDTSRVFSIGQQLKNIYYGAKGFVLLKKSRKYKLMNKQLKERIMLAITEVNGCAMCSYVHTKIALSSGMTSFEIKRILDGDTSDIPQGEAVALMFAQHFAYTHEKPNETTIKRLIDTYGFQKAELILAACNMITMTNGMGTSLDYLYSRLRFKRNKRSNILYEIFNPLLTMIFFPLLVILVYISTLFTNTKVLNRSYQISN